MLNVTENLKISQYKCNIHLWGFENSHWVQEGYMKSPEKLKVCSGIIGIRILETFFYHQKQFKIPLLNSNTNSA